MKNKNINLSTVFVVFLMFAIVMAFITIYLLSTNPKNDVLFSPYNKELDNNLGQQLKKQSEVDEKIEELLNQTFSFDDPYILNNPYGISPLSSLIFFDTEEDTKVDVYINDTFTTTVRSSKKHIIPIYGLYANTNNYVLLKTETAEKQILIKTNIYNDETEEYKEKFNINERLLTISDDVDNKNTLLRGFDKDNNLMFYLKFGNINDIIYHYDHFYVKYNSNKKLESLKLEMDYLGRIFSISSNVVEFKDNKTSVVKMYKDVIENYMIPEVVDNESYAKENRIKTEMIENKLIDTPVYNGNYEMIIENDYLIFDFSKEVDSILLVKKNSSYTYEYDIKDKNILKIDLNTDTSLYIKIGDTYYCLLKTINNL